MRLLFVTPYFPPYQVGGAEESTVALAMALQERGHEVRILTLQLGDAQDQLPMSARGWTSRVVLCGRRPSNGPGYSCVSRARSLMPPGTPISCTARHCISCPRRISGQEMQCLAVHEIGNMM